MCTSSRQNEKLSIHEILTDNVGIDNHSSVLCFSNFDKRNGKAISLVSNECSVACDHYTAKNLSRSRKKSKLICCNCWAVADGIRVDNGPRYSALSQHLAYVGVEASADVLPWSLISHNKPSDNITSSSHKSSSHHPWLKWIENCVYVHKLWIVLSKGKIYNVH